MSWFNHFNIRVSSLCKFITKFACNDKINNLGNKKENITLKKLKF